MARFGFVLALAASACGTDADNRALNAQFITEAILAPTCGAAECHSTFSQSGPNGQTYVFDTLVGMRSTIVNNGLVVLDSTQFDPLDAESSGLIVWLTKNDPLGQGIGRMPLDAPMPFEDINILQDWIRGVPDLRTGTTCKTKADCTTPGDSCDIPNGSTTGTCAVYRMPAVGAQCNPKKYNGMACIGRLLYRCGEDWNVIIDNTPPTDCSPTDCQQGKCL